MTFWEILGLIALVPFALFAGYIALMFSLGLLTAAMVALTWLAPQRVLGDVLLVPLLMQWGLGAVLSPSYGDAWVYMGMALLILAYPAAILLYALVLLAFGRIATPRAMQPPVV